MRALTLTESSIKASMVQKCRAKKGVNATVRTLENFLWARYERNIQQGVIVKNVLKMEAHLRA